MSQTAHITIDPEPLQSLRELLGDVDATAQVFSDMRLMDAMRQNRRTVLFRDPGYASSGVNPYLWYRGKVAVPQTDTLASILKAEPTAAGATVGPSYQADKAFRNWDSQSAVKVWRNGAAQNPATTGQMYTVNYPEGRVTFTDSLVNDWEMINASFCYYPIYRIAHSVLTMHLASNAGAVTAEKYGNDSWSYAAVGERIKALERVLYDFAPANIPNRKKLY